MDISEMDISEMTPSDVSEIHRFPIYPFPISWFSDKPPFLLAPQLQLQICSLILLFHINLNEFQSDLQMVGILMPGSSCFEYRYSKPCCICLFLSSASFYKSIQSRAGVFSSWLDQSSFLPRITGAIVRTSRLNFDRSWNLLFRYIKW